MAKEYQPVGAARYGKFYWCIKTDVSEDGEIYLHADDVRVGPDGSLLFTHIREKDNSEIITLAGC